MLYEFFVPVQMENLILWLQTGQSVEEIPASTGRRVPVARENGAPGEAGAAEGQVRPGRQIAGETQQISSDFVQVEKPGTLLQIRW